MEVIRGQCLDRRIDNQKTLAEQISTWQNHRNIRYAKADWQFTTADARVKLKRLYPQLE